MPHLNDLVHGLADHLWFLGDETAASFFLIGLILLPFFCCFCCVLGVYRRRALRKRYNERMQAARKWTPPENVGLPTGGASFDGLSPRRRVIRGATLRDLVQRRQSSASVYDGIGGDDETYDADDGGGGAFVVSPRGRRVSVPTCWAPGAVVPPPPPREVEELDPDL